MFHIQFVAIAFDQSNKRHTLELQLGTVRGGKERHGMAREALDRMNQPAVKAKMNLFLSRPSRSDQDGRKRQDAPMTYMIRPLRVCRLSTRQFAGKALTPHNRVFSVHRIPQNHWSGLCSNGSF